jgi:hypothetical protein
MVKRLWLGIGVAVGLVLWPLVLPVLLVLTLAAVLQHGRRSRQQRQQREQHPAICSQQPQPRSAATVLDPSVRANALAQVERINTEVHRERLERSFSEHP